MYYFIQHNFRAMYTFFRAAWQNIRQTGSVMESSPVLTKRMTNIIQFQKSLSIVELGAGTGVMTKRILEKMSPASTLTSFEINPVLYRQLTAVQDQRASHLNADVLRLPSYVPNDSADYILSGIPLANLDAGTKTQLLERCYEALKPGGFFIQFQYSLKDISAIRQRFPAVNYGFTLFNIPPAFIYYAQK